MSGPKVLIRIQLWKNLIQKNCKRNYRVILARELPNHFSSKRNQELVPMSLKLRISQWQLVLVEQPQLEKSRNCSSKLTNRRASLQVTSKPSKICKSNWNPLAVLRMDQLSSTSQFLDTSTSEVKPSQSVICWLTLELISMRSLIPKKIWVAIYHRCHSSKIRWARCMRIQSRFWSSLLIHTRRSCCHRMRTRTFNSKCSSTTYKHSIPSLPNSAMVRTSKFHYRMEFTKNWHQSLRSWSSKEPHICSAIQSVTSISTCMSALRFSTSWLKDKCTQTIQSYTTSHLIWQQSCRHSGTRMMLPSATHSSTDSPNRTTGQKWTSRIDTSEQTLRIPAINLIKYSRITVCKKYKKAKVELTLCNLGI